MVALARTIFKATFFTRPRREERQERGGPSSLRFGLADTGQNRDPTPADHGMITIIPAGPFEIYALSCVLPAHRITALLHTSHPP